MYNSKGQVMAFAYSTALINHLIMGYKFLLVVPYHQNMCKNQQSSIPVHRLYLPLLVFIKQNKYLRQ